MPDVHISEVGPRDGLQSVERTMPTAAKCAWIDALAAAGLREIEVGSFVPARLLPQLADTADVVAHALRHPGLTVMALVPNLKGAEAAFAAGVHKLTVPVSASAAHSMANVRRTPAQRVDHVIPHVPVRQWVLLWGILCQASFWSQCHSGIDRSVVRVSWSPLFTSTGFSWCHVVRVELAIVT